MRTSEEIVRQVFDDARDLCVRKNRDYGSSVFRTPILCEKVTASDAILVRMSDKVQRLQALATRPAEVVDETVEETMLDFGAYAFLWIALKKGAGDERSEAKQDEHAGAGRTDDVAGDELRGQAARP